MTDAQRIEAAEWLESDAAYIRRLADAITGDDSLYRKTIAAAEHSEYFAKVYRDLTLPEPTSPLIQPQTQTP